MDRKSFAVPETVKLSSAPEVVTGDGLERRYSNDLPEAVPRSANKYEEGKHGLIPAYPEPQNIPSDAVQTGHRKRQTRWKWAGLAVVLFIVVAGAVVGGVIGSRARSSTTETSPSFTATSSPSSAAVATSSSTTVHAPFSASSNTPLAMAFDWKTKTQYTYQQLDNGSVVEIPYTHQDGWQYAKASLVLSKLDHGVPLAAAVYDLSGNTYRLLLYPDANGNLYTRNTTNQGSWTDALNVMNPGDHFLANSPSLTVCADVNPTRRLRLYYASTYFQCLQEVGYEMSATSNGWEIHNQWNVVDLASGVACTMQNGIANLYYRDKSTSSVTQLYWDFTKSENGSWINGALPQAPYKTVSSGSSIAAATDGTSTDYLFWTLQNGTTMRAVYNGYASVSNYSVYSETPEYSSLAAGYQGVGPEKDVLLQYSSAASANVSWMLTSPDGTEQGSGTID